jgi:DNA (cytosine-5)-methyltransferase 1
MALRSLALCAGIGGLDLGVRLARSDHRLVGVVERQAYCAAVLVARMGDETVEQAPIWSDLRTFDPAPWRGAVDLVTAGFPCQPVSVAGKRLAQADERWLWPEVWRVARGVGCRYLFVENVPGLVSAGLADILADLAACGWDAEWDCVSAASVGAPHLRDRFFLLAVAPNADGERERDEGQQEPVRGGSGPTDARWPRRLWPTPTATDCKASGGAAYGTESGRHAGTTLTDAIVRGARHETDPDSGSEGLQGQRQSGATRDGDSDTHWQRTSAPLATFRRVDDGAAHRMDRDWAERIHALGNAVVPQAAARAWRTLEGRMKGTP